MIDLYYWTTPNGHKVSIFLEESGLLYKIHPIDISKNDQFKPDYLKISPNNKIPAIVDNEPSGANPVTMFESGAILVYLAKKTGKFYPKDLIGESKILPWLFWQMAGLGPMSGQAAHFSVFAKEKIPYAINRYNDEVKRLYGVADLELKTHAYLGGDEYTIADMATYPWILSHDKLGIDLKEFPNLSRWFKEIAERPAVKRAYEKAKEINPSA